MCLYIVAVASASTAVRQLPNKPPSCGKTTCWLLRAHFWPCRRGGEIVRAGHKGLSTGGGFDHQLTLSWFQQLQAPHPCPFPWDLHSVLLSIRSCSKDSSLERVRGCWDHLNWTTWLYLVKASIYNFKIPVDKSRDLLTLQPPKTGLKLLLITLATYQSEWLAFLLSSFPSVYRSQFSN